MTALDRPFGEMLGKVRRSALNGERLHLDHEHVIAFIQSPLYEMLAKLESDELAKAWQSNIDLASSGSRGEPTAANGPSATTIDPLPPAAESQLASAITTLAIRRPKRNRPLPTTSQSTDSPKRSTPTPRRASAG